MDKSLLSQEEDSLESPSPMLKRLGSSDLIYHSLIFQSAPLEGNDSIIEEANDYSYLQRMFGDSRISHWKIWLIIIIISRQGRQQNSINDPKPKPTTGVATTTGGW